MKDLNYKAELDISDVLSKIKNMEIAVENGNKVISQQIIQMNVSFQNMNSVLNESSASIANGIKQITESSSYSSSAIDQMKEAILNLSGHSDIITQLSNSFLNTSNFIDEYTQKIVNANIKNGGFTDGFAFLDMAIQDMTKNMDLATISTSLIDFAVKGLNDPIGFTVELVSNLALGLGTLSLMGDKNYQTLEMNKKIVEDNAIAVQADIDAYNKLQESYDKQISSNLALIDNSKRLYTELSSITDANGRVKDGFTGLASFIIKELNSSLGTNLQLVDGVIQGYGDLGGSIDNSLEKMEAQAILKTQKEAYDTAIASIDEASAKVVAQENDLISIKQKNQQVISNYYDEANKARLRDDEWSARYYENQAALAQKEIDDQQKRFDDEKSILKNYLDDIELLKENATAYEEERYADVKTKQEADFAEDTTAQLEAYQDRYDQLKAQRDVYISEGNEKRAAETQQEMDDIVNKGVAQLEAEGINNDNELVALETFITDKQARLTEMYATDESQWTEEQRKEAEDLQNSINQNLGLYTQYASDKVNKSIELTQALGENATEEQRQAAETARQQAASTLQILGQNAIDKLNVLADLKQKREAGDKSITDSMIKEAERQAVEAEAKYGEVARKIEESWEDLPKESQETFQNVMAPMLTEMEKKEPSLFEKANGIASGILGRLKKAFDINSPSKKVKKIFESVMEGAEVGLDNKKSKLLNQTEEIATDVIHTFSDVDGINTENMISKMKSARMHQQLQMVSSLDGSVQKELGMFQKIKVELPELKGTFKGKIENHIDIDGRETAIQLAPFMSEELAFLKG